MGGRGFGGCRGGALGVAAAASRVESWDGADRLLGAAPEDLEHAGRHAVHLKLELPLVALDLPQLSRPRGDGVLERAHRRGGRNKVKDQGSQQADNGLMKWSAVLRFDLFKPPQETKERFEMKAIPLPSL